MPFIKTDISGLLIFEPKVFGDSRGYFFESYNEKTFQQEEVNGTKTYATIVRHGNIGSRDAAARALAEDAGPRTLHAVDWRPGACGLPVAVHQGTRRPADAGLRLTTLSACAARA